MLTEIPKSELNDAIAELGKVRKQWLKRPGVAAVDVGYKIKDGELTEELAIRVHVKRKLPRAQLSEHELFPEHLGKYAVDIIEADYAPLRLLVAAEPLNVEAVDRTHRVDPLVGGISVGNPRVTGGTLGAIVWDRTDAQVCILSTWHSLCGSFSCTASESIYQPAVVDGGSADDQVAELKRWRLDKDTDAALARLTTARGYSRDILGLNPILGLEPPSLGSNIAKSGRSTGVTRGIIDGVNTSVVLDYGGGSLKTLHDQIHIAPRPPWGAIEDALSMGGDSGSVWVNEATGKAVGLLIASERGPSPSWNAIANRMVRVAELLDFSFTPLFYPPRSIEKYQISAKKPPSMMDEPIDTEKLTIGQIISAIKPGQLWAIIGAVLGAVSAIAAAAYKLGTIVGSAP